MKFTTDRPYYWLFAILAFVGFSADQVSKYIVFAKLFPPDANQSITQLDIIPGYFALRTFYTKDPFPRNEPGYALRTISGERIPHVNRGALFGIGNGDGEDGSPGWNTFFAIVSVAAAAFILIWASRPLVAHDRFLSIALGLILGGTLGNLYDRVVFSGVRDFLHCHFNAHVWPDFNIADSCLVCGAGALLVHSFFASEPAAQPAKTDAAAESVPVQTASPTPGV